MNNPFSQRISDVIQFSKEEANRLRNNYIGPEHLLLGLIREGEGKAVQILKDLYVDLEMVKKTLENDLRSSAVTPENYSEDITFDEKASKILKMSILESRILKSPATDTEHMLLAIMRENQNKASQILEENEVTYQKVMDKLVPKAEPQSGLDFGEDEPGNVYSGYYYHKPGDTKGGITMKYSNGNTKETGYHSVDSAEDALGDILS